MFGQEAARVGWRRPRLCPPCEDPTISLSTAGGRPSFPGGRAPALSFLRRRLWRRRTLPRERGSRTFAFGRRRPLPFRGSEGPARRLFRRLRCPPHSPGGEGHAFWLLAAGACAPFDTSLAVSSASTRRPHEGRAGRPSPRPPYSRAFVGPAPTPPAAPAHTLPRRGAHIGSALAPGMRASGVPTSRKPPFPRLFFGMPKPLLLPPHPAPAPLAWAGASPDHPCAALARAHTRHIPPRAPALAAAGSRPSLHVPATAHAHPTPRRTRAGRPSALRRGPSSGRPHTPSHRRHCGPCPSGDRDGCC